MVIPIQPKRYRTFFVCIFIGKIPESIGSLVQLTSLRLGGNQLSGGKMVRPVQPLLITAFLIGSIPESLGSLTSLKVLYLQFNKLTGVLKSGHTSTTT